MAFFALRMLEAALELATQDADVEDLALRYLREFLRIATDINRDLDDGGQNNDTRARAHITHTHHACERAPANPHAHMCTHALAHARALTHRLENVHTHTHTHARAHAH